ELKRVVKEKKIAWKKYLTTKTQSDYATYKEKRSAAKNAVLIAKSKSWKDFGDKMEGAYKDNRKLFYRIIKRLRTDKECPLKFVKDKEGNLLTREEEIMERWRQYFAELLDNSSTAVTPGTETTQNSEREQTDPNTEYNITLSELHAAIKKMKLGKAPGADNITPEMIKYMGSAGE
ncbi:uncharacterized protein LOC103523195, partial [Diaphorina citri]|uniref:Uncharacterized protein LOC103523195 n=1 Tax=Diaphorina citri TaxID=121845 RepID=A0A1S3DRN2_DIACI